VAEPGLTTEPPAGPATTPRELAAYLARLEQTADGAAARVGGFRDAFCRLAGHVVRLRFAGPALVPRLLPALAHVRTEPVDVPALTVRLFDSTTTDAHLPAPPWPPAAFDGFGKVRASIAGELNGVFDSGTFSVYRPHHDQALYWIRDPRDIHPSETGSPLQTILQLWLATRGLQVAHAGAVGDQSGCVLLVGNGGAGKSSTALACLPSDDLGILGEDYCLLGPEPTPQVHTIYSSAKATDDTLDRLPFLRPMVTNRRRPASDKALCLLADHVPGKLLASAPLRAVAIPRITGRRRTTTSEATAAAALAALAPSTLLQLHGAGETTLARLAQAVRAVPCHYLDVGTDPAGVPRAIHSLLNA
jgi:hypothetical protein